MRHAVRFRVIEENINPVHGSLATLQLLLQWDPSLVCYAMQALFKAGPRK